MSVKIEVIKVVIVVDEEILLLERERVSKDRQVIRVGKRFLNDLRDEVIGTGRIRRGRFKIFANARDISMDKFLVVKEVLNKRCLRGGGVEGVSDCKEIVDRERRDSFFEMLNKEISEFNEFERFSRKRFLRGEFSGDLCGNL